MADRINAYYWVLFEEAKEHIILEWYDGSWLQGLSELDEHQLSQIKEVIEEPVEYKPTKQRKDGYYWVCFKFQKNRESWHVCEWRNGRWVDDGQVNFSLIDRVMEQPIKEPVELIKPIKDNVLALDADIPREYLKEGYWLKASHKNIYCITVDKLESGNIYALAHKINKSHIVVDIENIKNGQKVLFDDTFCSDVLSFDIYPKYFFPHFGEEGGPAVNGIPSRYINLKPPQWSHDGKKNQSHDLEDFTFLIKNAYALALEVSGLETY